MALKNLRVLDMTRVLAGPWSSQLLGDMGAEIIKIERKNVGDDTRYWGPPFAKGTKESAYYLSANRNKKSLAVDLNSEKGVDIIKKLIPHCDILMENFKVGNMDKWQLGFKDVHVINPKLIYCSITGFGQNGPRKDEAGYDFMIQGMSGLMSITGFKEGDPVKLGVAWCDIMTGMYASTAILAAVNHRHFTGRGQHIDLSLFDVTTACLANQGSNYLVGGKIPNRMGNAHPNIVPYELFKVKDGDLIIAVGNDKQFKKFCEIGGNSNFGEDARFATNESRVKNRIECVNIIKPMLLQKTRSEWIELLEKEGIPCAPVNNIAEAFADKQIRHRGGKIDILHPTANVNASNDNSNSGGGGGKVPIFANPIHFSDPETKIVDYKHPPLLGENTEEILRNVLSMSESEIEHLKRDKVI